MVKIIKTHGEEITFSSLAEKDGNHSERSMGLGILCIAASSDQDAM
jgi:hypothetical protein